MILSIIVILILGLLAGCGTNKSDTDDGSTVRIAYFPNVTHAQALIGMQNGQFQKALGDTKIQWKQFNAGSSEVEAFLAGAVDIGYIGPGPVINGYTKSKGDIQIISGAADAGAVLIARKDSTIKSIKDLSGKRVAIPQYANTQDLCLRFLLQENGLKDMAKGGTVEIVQANNPDIQSLLGRGDIDAALVPEPWGATLENTIGAKVVLDYNEIWRQGKYPVTVIAVRREFLQEHPDIVEKFLRAHLELSDYIEKNRDQAANEANEQFKNLTRKSLPKDVLHTSFNRLNITLDPEIEATKDMINMSIKTGFIRRPYDDKDLFKLDILNKILKEKGKDTVN
ncbi:sulfate ABC transporter substrate-binding protein [Clostridium pasteurianum]|uniref:aliphatic sulfonate ABC transporter substrate-binding protein n=1 Tax=Clostridium pasteurianum TaxID=1501 RepID=UPI000977EAB9|nr:aliphatic sulfonate ABC transporter substrate-binding protein [Clostridium pasteurianum]OMH20953.1 sulfate ABC transporter substrate-binding protein [Clostridium pasteurianum]